VSLRRCHAPVTLAGIALGLVLMSGTALAHGDMGDQPPEAQVVEPGGMMSGGRGSGPMMETSLEIVVPDEVKLGSPFQARAVLSDADGRPIAGMTIVFEADASWSEELAGHMVIGTAVTNDRGIATLSTTARTSGSYEVAGYFPGNDRFDAVAEEAELEVHGGSQLYVPAAGIRIPWLNLWVLAGVVGLVWLTYFLVGSRLLRIARSTLTERALAKGGAPGAPIASRRSFLSLALPFGMETAVAVGGLGLIGVIARSPRTHGNLASPPATALARAPVTHLGQAMGMREMPPVLGRTVSFSQEVLPIFLANGGPHVVAPRSSPPPGGLRLDSYRAVMAKEGVVTPGEPDESEIVEHLLSPGMQMPPSLPPLPLEQIQLIVTWISQGALDN
jgi:hypothetical protein